MGFHKITIQNRRFLGRRLQSSNSFSMCCSSLKPYGHRWHGEIIVNRAYKRLLFSTDENVQATCNKQGYSTQNSDLIRNHIGKLCVTKNKTRWNSYLECMKCFSKLLKKKYEAMETYLRHLDLVSRKQTRIYPRIREDPTACGRCSRCASIINFNFNELFRSKINHSSWKTEETSNKHNDQNTNAFVCSLLDSLKNQIGHMFKIPQIRLVTVCNPSFKDNGSRKKNRKVTNFCYRKNIRGEKGDDWKIKTKVN